MQAKPMIQLQDSANGLVKAVVEFCRFVRANGVGAGTQGTIGCIQALETVRTFDPDTFRFTLRAVLCASKDEWLSFDRLFAAFCGEPESRPGINAENSAGRRFSVLGNEKISPIFSGDFAESDREPEDEGKAAF